MPARQEDLRLRAGAWIGGQVPELGDRRPEGVAQVADCREDHVGREGTRQVVERALQGAD